MPLHLSHKSTCNIACGISINLVTLFNVIFALSKQKNNQVTRSQIMNFMHHFTTVFSCHQVPPVAEKIDCRVTCYEKNYLFILRTVDCLFNVQDLSV